MALIAHGTTSDVSYLTSTVITMNTTDASAAVVGNSATVEASAFTVDQLVASGNKILHDTPDNLWWKMTPQEVVAFAFPEWDIVAARENANYNKPTFPVPSVLLRHRVQQDLWFLIASPGRELLPGRMSTMGQFFRFNPKRQKFAVGTPDDVLARTIGRRTADAHQDVAWWLLDQFSATYTTPNAAFTFDTRTHAPVWLMLTEADTRLRAVHSSGTPLKDTRSVLRYALPDWHLLGLRESADEKDSNWSSTALLCHRDDSDRLLTVSAWMERLVNTDDLPVSLRSSGHHGHPRLTFALHTTHTLLERQRADKVTWPKSTDLWWTLYHLAHAHPNRDTALACREEMEAARALLAMRSNCSDDEEADLDLLNHRYLIAD